MSQECWYTFNPNAREAEASGPLSSLPARPTEQILGQLGIYREKSLSSQEKNKAHRIN